MYARWKNKYLSQGTAGLKSSYHHVDPELRTLEEENERLKRIAAKKMMKKEGKYILKENSVTILYRKYRITA